MSNKITVRLLIAASVLMLHAGGVFAFMKLWPYAALLGAGSLGCLMGAAGFKTKRMNNALFGKTSARSISGRILTEDTR